MQPFGDEIRSVGVLSRHARTSSDSEDVAEQRAEQRAQQVHAHFTSNGSAPVPTNIIAGRQLTPMHGRPRRLTVLG